MEKYRFYNDDFFLPTIEEEEYVSDIWESCTPSQRKEFERDLKVEEPNLFKHFHDNFLVNHPEYVP